MHKMFLEVILLRALIMKKRKFKLFIAFFVLSVIFAFTLSIMLFSPVFNSLAESGALNSGRNILYSSIALVSKEEDFSDVTLISRQDDKITGISLNSGKANRILSSFATTVNASLSGEEYSTFYIPVGNLTKIHILSGRGFKIPIKTVYLGGVDAKIVSDFSDAGINQTRHSVYISAKLSLRLMSPFSEDIKEAEALIPISETVIVGETPSYLIPYTK